MKRSILLSSFVLAIFCLVTVVGADIKSLQRDKVREVGAEPAKQGISHKASRAINVETYRSPTRLHKVLIDSKDVTALSRSLSSGAIEVADYGSFRLVAMDESQMVDRQGRVRDDYNVLMLRSRAIDTTAQDAPGTLLGLGKSLTAGLEVSGPARESRADKQKADKQKAESSLRLVQFVGPVKQEWLDSLRSNGLEPIAYVPNNAYLVRGKRAATERLIRAASEGDSFIQWEGAFLDEYKVHPALVEALNNPGAGELTVAIQIAREAGQSGAGANGDVKRVKELASATLTDAYDVLGFTNLRLRVKASELGRLASLGNVVNIEPWAEPQLHDERSSQIIAGELSDDGKQARGPGYLQWLQARGLATPFNFAIDITDTGLDRGAVTADNLHPDFLDANGQSRVAYARDYTSELDAGDAAGHGTINVSIAGGGNTSAANGMRDAAGFNYGLGIAPFARLGSSKIFQGTGRFDLVEPYSKLISEAYNDGARISSNSWGAGLNEYTIDSQEYDARVRDASPAQPGNQEMVILFSAGNAGGGGNIGSPGSGKNVISVAASESFRKEGEDGCGVLDDDADSALDIAFFSSGGPLKDGRMKPDFSAPGSHIQGAATQHPDFIGEGVCGKSFEEPYFPTGQTLYTWSSGTSHAAPAAAGAAALVRQFFLNKGQEPSAALIRTLLVNSTTFMTGELAAGDLPHPRQGWGLLNLSRTFDSQPRIILDQTHTFSASGQEFLLTGEVKDASMPFRVTLGWTDAPGLSVFAPWVNDLDLEVVINGQVYAANNLKGEVSQPGGAPGAKDNTEGVWLPAGTTGTFLVRVRSSNIAGDGVPGNGDLSDQDFALVVYNGERKEAAVAKIAGIEIASGSDAVADPGETASMTLAVTNASPVALSGGRGVLTTTTAGVTITSAEADFPLINRDQTGESVAPFKFTVAGSVACGTPIEFVLSVTSQGAISRVPFTVAAGNLTSSEFFTDDVESGGAKWTHGSLVKKKKNRIDTWVISSKRFRSGGSAWFTPNLGKATDANLDTAPIRLPANGRNLKLEFFHSFEFESGGFDGGVLEISVDGGKFEDLGPKILKGQYNGAVLNVPSNALKERPAWIGGRHGALQPVVVDLSQFAGKTVVIRFRIGTDSDVRSLGWYVDDVVIRGDHVNCAAVP